MSVLQRQCLDRRIPDQATLEKEVAVWEQQRNEEKVTIDWRFSITDARESSSGFIPLYQLDEVFVEPFKSNSPS